MAAFGPVSYASADGRGACVQSFAAPELAFSACLSILYTGNNFLQIGRQKNLLYAISALSLPIISALSVVSGTVASFATLRRRLRRPFCSFVLVILSSRTTRPWPPAGETAHQEMDRVQRLTGDSAEARQGNLRGLVRFVEERVKQVFELAAVNLALCRSGQSRIAAIFANGRGTGSLRSAERPSFSFTARENWPCCEPSRTAAALSGRRGGGAGFLRSARAALDLLPI